MTDSRIDAIYLDGGTAMEYFTGIRWGNSERMMAAVIPARGEVKYVGPHFEEERIRELMKIGSDLRTWEEHESPYKVVAGIFTDMGLRTRSDRNGGACALSFMTVSGGSSNLDYISADPVTVPCRLL